MFGPNPSVEFGRWTTNRNARVRSPVLLAILCLVVGAGAAQAQTSEHVPGYEVNLVVEGSGVLRVNEIIDYDFGSSSHHGIVRDLVTRRHFDDRYDRVYAVEDIKVKGSPGTPDQFQTESIQNGMRIRIGDPDRTITGRHRYTIAYRVRGALDAFADHDELNWNALGLDSLVPIDDGVVKVQGPAAIARIACFAGPLGSNLPCASATSQGMTARFSQAGLAPREGLTVVVGFPKGAVATPRPILKERWSFGRAFAATPVTVSAFLLLLAAAVGGVGRLVFKSGRDRQFAGSDVDVVFGSGEERPVPLTGGKIIPVEFEPPDKIRPGQVGTLIDEIANPLDVTATIVDLAVRGYLQIREIEKKGIFGKPDWTLTKLKGPDGLVAYERLLFEGLFSGEEEVDLSDLRNTFSERLHKVQDALYDDAVKQGWFTARPDTVRFRWRLIGVALSVGGVGLLVVTAAFTHFGLVAIALPIAGLLVLANAHRMPSRTAKGTAVLRRVKGFRRFIEESEKERARFAERKNLFSEYLPYAVVFGATKKWAKAFAGLDDTMPETTWYVGPGPFTMGAFYSSIDHFSVNTAGTMTSVPSSSGSGFSGGFSGGGGGGGGVGSW
jgi:uncharacterized protein (TIGR04222 family)